MNMTLECVTIGSGGYKITLPCESNINGTASVRYRSAVIEQIPNSFLQGLADIDNGRVVDLDRALEDPPNQV